MTRAEQARRRALLAGLACVAVDLAWPRLANAHGDHDAAANPAPAAGRPARAQSVAAVPLTLANGLPSDLLTRTRGCATAVQLMFTGCGTTCLTQGALFEGVQEQLHARSMDARLLSISIDALGDDARTLATWLKRFNARPAMWTAGVPAVASIEGLFAEFRVGKGPAEVVEHLNRAFIFNRAGVLTWATRVDPSAGEVAESLVRYG